MWRSLVVLLAACGSSDGPKPFVDIDKHLTRYDELGLPLVGDIAFRAQLVSPARDYATSNGTVTVDCAACSLGDGSGTHGFEVPRISIGAIHGKITVANGTGTVALTAGDPETVAIEVSGSITLAHELDASSADLTLRFKPADKLRTTDPKTYAVLNLTGAARGDDGWFRMRIRGTRADARATTN